MFSVTIPEYETKVMNNLIDNDPDKYVVNKPGDSEMTTMLDELVINPINYPLLSPPFSRNKCSRQKASKESRI